MCIHLKPLEDYLKKLGIAETFRGQPWSENCREWVYFDCVLNPESLKTKLKLGKSVVVWNYEDIKVGSELGLECKKCKDAIIGPHPNSNYSNNKRIIE